MEGWGSFSLGIFLSVLGVVGPVTAKGLVLVCDKYPALFTLLFVECGLKERFLVGPEK